LEVARHDAAELVNRPDFETDSDYKPLLDYLMEAKLESINFD